MSLIKPFLDYISKPDYIFVLPTNIASQIWANWVIRNEFLTGVSAVTMERFLSWDSFKSQILNKALGSKKKISSSQLKLISEEILEKEDFSGLDIDQILPELKFLIENKTDAVSSEYKKLYEEFETRLGNEYYIADWETETVQKYLEEKLSAHYVIFFPEVLPEYQDLFQNKKYKNIEVISGNDTENINRDTNGFEFENSVQEVREVTNFIIRKKEEGIDFADMAVTIPDYETYGAYVEREFALHDIPYETRIEKPLSAYASGNILKDISAFCNHNFSMESVQNLFGNYSLPWKFETKVLIQKFIDFGKTKNCVYSDNKEADIWENTLAEIIKGLEKQRYEELQKFYLTIKQDILEIINSQSFARLCDLFTNFTKKYFDIPEGFRNKNIHQLVIQKIIMLLKQLTSDEKNGFSNKLKCTPFEYAVKTVAATAFEPAVSGENVQIFEYKTACCAPYKVHVVLDASQNALSQAVQYKKLKFLSDSIRKTILIKKYGEDFDYNPTALIIKLYDCINSDAWAQDDFESECIFTCSKTAWGKTGFLNCNIENKNQEKEVFFNSKTVDSYIQERGLIENKKIVQNFENQLQGYKNWLEQYPEDYESDRELWKSEITERINKKLKKNGEYKFSVSMLKKFFDNPEQWLFEEILGVKALKDEPEIIDRFLNGTINHKILETYLTKLKGNNLTLEIGNSERELPPKHQGCFEEALKETLTFFDNDNSISPATKKLIQDKKDEYTSKFKKTICCFSKEFEGLEVFGIEKEYDNLKFNDKDKYYYKGAIDCILKDKIDGTYVVIDHKTTGSAIPGLGKTVVYDGDREDKIPVFQMPLYLKFLEKEDKVGLEKITRCTYFNIKEGKFSDFYNKERQGTKGKGMKQPFPYINEIEKTQQRCIALVEEAVKRFESGDFTLPEINDTYAHLIKDAYDQEFKRIGRFFFNITGRDN